MRKQLWRWVLVIGVMCSSAHLCQAKVVTTESGEKKAAYATHEELLVASIENMEQTVALYEKITDLESANKAMAELKKLHKERRDFGPFFKSLGEPSAEKEEELKKKYGQRMEAAQKKYMKELMRVVENNDIKALLEEHLK